MMPNPLAAAKDFKPAGKPLVLAARITGPGKSALSRWRAETAGTCSRPKPSPATSRQAERCGRAGYQGSDPTKGEAVVPHSRSGPLNAILVADTDLLHDQFWVDHAGIARPADGGAASASNAAFVVNSLENLAGGEALATLRGRGANDRPFERVAELRREAERSYREKEQALNAKLKELQGKLAAAGDARRGWPSDPVSRRTARRSRASAAR